MKAAVQECPWRLHYKRAGKPLDLKQACKLSVEAGFEYWDATLPMDKKELDQLAQVLSQSGMQCPSMYMDSPIHNGTWQASVDDLLRSVRAAKALGFEVLAFNPAPIDWNARTDKTDAQLKTQAEALKALSLGVKDLGLHLAYHMHGAEMRSHGRELWQMLEAVDKDDMGFVLEPEWILRPPDGGAEQLSGILEKLLNRVTLVHVRQAKNGSPIAGMLPGDIDWANILRTLKAAGYTGTVTYEGYIGDFEGGGTEDLNELMAQLKQTRKWMAQTAGF